MSCTAIYREGETRIRVRVLLDEKRLHKAYEGGTGRFVYLEALDGPKPGHLFMVTHSAKRERCNLWSLEMES